MADAATKLAVTNFDTLPHDQTLRVEIRTIAPPTPIMGHVHSQPLHAHVGPRHRDETGYPPPSMVDDAGSIPLPNARFHAPSQQLRHKVRAATLRSQHHTSIYMRLVLRAKEQGATTDTTETALHTRLRENSKEGTNLLKFIHGQLYNGKLAKRYGHAPTDECHLCHRPDSCTHIA